jgi:predicted kinase
MRKWMRERIQRRKKKPSEQTNEPARPPLQPAYFDAEQASTPAADAVAHETEPSGELEQARPADTRENINANVHDRSQHQPPEEAPSPVQPLASIAQGRPRRRRGGRGRGGRGREQAVYQAFTPSAVRGTIPGAAIGDQPPGLEGSGAETHGERQGRKAIPQSAPVTAPVAPARPPKGLVVLAIGLPGSGKSSWFKRHNVAPLSSDMMRSLLFDDIREQRFQDLVFSNLRSMLKARLIAKRPMNYVDATNLTPQERQHWIKLAKDYGYEVQAVFFDVPLEVCIERHQRRDRVVPEDVMRRMAAKLKPPAFEEGFAKITVVRVKKKEEPE